METKVETKGRCLKQKPQKNVIYWLAPREFLGLLSYTTQDDLQGVVCTQNAEPDRHAHREI